MRKTTQAPTRIGQTSVSIFSYVGRGPGFGLNHRYSKTRFGAT